MRHPIYFAIILATAVWTVSACKHKPTMREMGILLDTLNVQATASLTDSIPSPHCEVDLEVIVISNKEYAPVNDSLLRSGILSPEYLSLTDKQITPRAAIDSFIRRYEADYKTFYSGIFTDESDSQSASIGYTLRTSIEEGKDSTLCYKAFVSHKQGAITTNYTLCRNIDLPRKRLLQLDDIFVHGYERGLSEAIANQLMKQSANKDLQSLRQSGFFVNSDIYPTPNFILGDKSITFVYVAGEIADRDRGEIQVEVKYSEIKRLLKR